MRVQYLYKNVFLFHGACYFNLLMKALLSSIVNSNESAIETSLQSHIVLLLLMHCAEYTLV